MKISLFKPKNTPHQKQRKIIPNTISQSPYKNNFIFLGIAMFGFTFPIGLEMFGLYCLREDFYLVSKKISQKIKNNTLTSLTFFLKKDMELSEDQDFTLATVHLIKSGKTIDLFIGYPENLKSHKNTSDLIDHKILDTLLLESLKKAILNIKKYDYNQENPLKNREELNHENHDILSDVQIIAQNSLQISQEKIIALTKNMDENFKNQKLIENENSKILLESPTTDEILIPVQDFTKIPETHSTGLKIHYKDDSENKIVKDNLFFDEIIHQIKKIPSKNKFT